MKTVTIETRKSRTDSRATDWVVRVNGREIFRTAHLVEARYIAEAARVQA